MSTPRSSKQTTTTTTTATKKRAASPEAEPAEDTTSTPTPTPTPTVPSAQDNHDRVFSSALIHDRQSTFVAHFHPAPGVFVKQQQQQQSGTAPVSGSGSKPQLSLTATIKRLQTHPKFTSASHRIVAWRRRSSQQTLFGAPNNSDPAGSGRKAIYATGSEDDGEKYAGKRLERLLADLDVEGVVVVARWYGGVLLGPVRFTHIETVAREAVRKWKESVDAGGGAGSKRQKLLDPHGYVADGDGDGDGDSPDETALKSRLAEQLAERDRSIVVLRGLLADKTKAAAAPMTADGEKKPESSSSSQPEQQQQSSSAPSPSPVKKIDYDDMPLARLKQLEKARDATIAFILKQLDKLEEEGGEEEEK
ncbi:hypothetical protein AYL99_11518 [Fonsecaea erecta]|uniref:Impact N-terminal domain-containing protein n=1 Tax=Fonsecaea erecta TaxID=1367422 RepID=A0A178Z3V1_9EURO|nr:hypothetical protein AYL99_11518 [Fonsecaea erecta]OAP54417.1 hypothetical protein AYL99_11518 [Fonsecaea erecta]